MPAGRLRRWQVAARLGPRAAMGALAFAVLMGLELGLSVLLFGNTVQAHLARICEVPAALGLAGQLVFAALPALLLVLPPRS